jgi:hypothetical protein
MAMQPLRLGRESNQAKIEMSAICVRFISSFLIHAANPGMAGVNECLRAVPDATSAAEIQRSIKGRA